MTDPAQPARTFFEAHPEIDVLEAFIVDVNGQLRGKWVPVRSAAKVMKGELRFAMGGLLATMNDAMAVFTASAIEVCRRVC